jgi:long-chain-fatty-acid---luciferin-component ligase
VVAIGGWKRRSGERIPRAEFDDRIAAGLGIETRQIRDAFNMVELNTAVLECEYHQMHLPAWIHARARSAVDLAVLPSEESGILSYLDPTPTSYPGFILSDDVGHVKHAARCRCGRQTDILVVERRLNTMETRGCALRIDGLRHARRPTTSDRRESA